MKNLLFLFAALFLYSCNIKSTHQVANQPNIVIILADDLGYADVGFHGSDIKTPNLDNFANKGVRLENFYSCPMCSPTRAGLMTGRYPIRYGLMRAVIPPYRNFGLNPDETLLPEVLEQAGYKHRACIGKWHLGHMQTKWHPNQQGFTHFVGCYNGAIDYFTRMREGETDWHRNSETVHTKGYVTDLIADEAVNFINAVPKAEPYFLYVPFTAPHAPFQAKEQDIAKYPHRSGNQQIYAAMVDCMDQGIGRILDAIDKRGDRDNTFILFFSDNGGVKEVASNAPMKGNKLTMYEGGIRVVAAAYWPAGGIEGGKIIYNQMGYIDILPTIISISHIDINTDNLDGINVLESMQGNTQVTSRKWFSYLDQDGQEREKLAVNYLDWKLIIERDAPDAVTHQKDESILFKMDSLHIESKDVKEDNPQVYHELQKSIEEFLKLKSNDQIPRYPDGNERFKAPKDWFIK